MLERRNFLAVGALLVFFGGLFMLAIYQIFDPHSSLHKHVEVKEKAIARCNGYGDPEFYQSVREYYNDNGKEINDLLACEGDTNASKCAEQLDCKIYTSYDNWICVGHRCGFNLGTSKQESSK
eukprot:Nk52_evm25s289 gene=Nk52_evmTU25s289